MSLETFEFDPDFSKIKDSGERQRLYIQWLTIRVQVLHTEARRWAVKTDKLRAKWASKVGQSHEGALIRDAVEADIMALQSHAVKKAISAEQMYTRWAEREAGVLTAMVASYQWHAQVNAQNARFPSLHIAMPILQPFDSPTPIEMNVIAKMLHTES